MIYHADANVSQHLFVSSNRLCEMSPSWLIMGDKGQNKTIYAGECRCSIIIVVIIHRPSGANADEHRLVQRHTASICRKIALKRTLQNQRSNRKAA